MKKLPVLHILNGNASIPAFKEAGLAGQVLVWCEILSEGPALSSLPEHAFWEVRKRFITSEFNATAADYKVKILDELPKLEQARTFFEVILWFDADLMCQVNLLYLLQKLYRQKVKIISVCTPPIPENIGLLSPEEIAALFYERKSVSETQLRQADELWQLYTSSDPTQLQLYLQQETIELPVLQQALALHLRRFPNCKTGLGKPQEQLLYLVKRGITGINAVMEEFWKEFAGYGYGDLQLQKLVEQLQPELINQQEPFSLTNLGHKVLAKKATYLKWIEKGVWLGGVQLKLNNYWCYQEQEKQLLIQY